jgi:hypothetical protein
VPRARRAVLEGGNPKAREPKANDGA